MTLRAILFDFGGTLDGPGQHWLPRFAAHYRHAGMAIDTGRLRSAFGHSTRAAYADPAMRSRRLGETVAFHVARQFEFLGITDSLVAGQIIDSFVDETSRALADSRAVLECLHPHFRLGVISNFYGNVERLLEDAAIRPLLSVVVDSALVGVSKPDPAIFQLALDALGCAPADAIYAGDSHEKDIAGAHAAGLKTAWLASPSEESADRLPRADYVVRDLHELQALLLPGTAA